MSATNPSARDEILARVRAAVADAHEPSDPARGYRDRPVTGDVVGLFVERVEDYRAVVERCSPEEVETRIAAALAGASDVLVPDGLPWTVPGATPDHGFSAADLDSFDAVVTGATLGIAETGTIVLTHGPGQGRRALTLVPDLHVCVVLASAVVPGVPDATAVLDPARPQTWISGPSATSDIELNRVEGVHGPRRLHVLVVSTAAP
ncbi:MAG: LutC/YkgG family protein [Nocardioidaceae bacterium]